MARTTDKDVRRAFENLVDQMAGMGMDVEGANIQSQSGLGVGGTLYTVANLPGGIGTFAAVGAGRTYDALVFAGSVLRAARRHAAGAS